MKSVYVIINKDFSVFETYNTLSLLCEKYSLTYNTLTKQGHSFWVDDYIMKTTVDTQLIEVYKKLVESSKKVDPEKTESYQNFLKKLESWQQ